MGEEIEEDTYRQKLIDSIPSERRRQKIGEEEEENYAQIPKQAVIERNKKGRE